MKSIILAVLVAVSLSPTLAADSKDKAGEKYPPAMSVVLPQSGIGVLVLEAEVSFDGTMKKVYTGIVHIAMADDWKIVSIQCHAQPSGIGKHMYTVVYSHKQFRPEWLTTVTFDLENVRGQYHGAQDTATVIPRDGQVTFITTSDAIKELKTYDKIN